MSHSLSFYKLYEDLVSVSAGVPPELKFLLFMTENYVKKLHVVYDKV